MAVLVAVASRHGATVEIADAIGIAIHGRGFRVDVVRLTEPAGSGSTPDPADYEAVVLGSGVYLGRWLAPATHFVNKNEEALRDLPVWGFSSGPVGNGPADDGGQLPAPDLVDALNPVGYRTFGGKLDRHGLGLAERAVVTLLGVHDEDNRNLDDATSWAHRIADRLQAIQASESSGGSGVTLTPEWRS